VHGALLAAVHPDNTPHGYNLTFAFPMLMFIIVAGALYLRFRAAHNVPGHVALGSSRWASAGGAGAAGTVGAGSAQQADPADAAVSAVDPAGRTEAAAEPVPAQPASEGTEDSE